MKTPRPKVPKLVKFVSWLMLMTASLHAQYFSPSSFLHKDVQAEALDADQSDAADINYQFLYDSAGNLKASGSQTSINDYNYTPLWTASAAQSTIAVTDFDDGFCNSIWTAVPWPSYATAGTGNSDNHCMIWQPSSDTLWEFWATQTTGAYAYPHIGAKHGGRMTNVSTSSGVYPSPYGAPASGISLAAGMITLAEADQIAADPNYRIPHAIAIGLPWCEAAHLAPANRDDGFSAGPSHTIREGRRFRLPAGIAIPSGPPLLRALVIAARDYGIFVRDQTASVIVLYVQDGKTRANEGGTNPWTLTALRGTDTWWEFHLLNSFPWASLQALAPCPAMATGPVGWWKLDEGVNVTAADSSGSGVTGTLVSSPTWTAGELGNAINCNGTSSYVNMNNASATGPLKPSLPVTVSAWVKMNSATQGNVFSSDQWDTAKYAGYNLSVGTTVGCGYGSGTGGNGPAFRRSKGGTTTLVAGQWYHVAAVINSATDMHLYVNGVDDGGTYSGTGAAMAYTAAPSKIGTGGASGFLNGVVDDVRVYNRALTAEEVEALWVIVDNSFNDNRLGKGDLPFDTNWSVVGTSPVTLTTGQFNTSGNTTAGLVYTPTGSYSAAKGGIFATRVLNVGTSINLEADFRVVGTIPNSGGALRFALGSSANTYAFLFGTGTSPSAGFNVYSVDAIAGTATVLTTTGTPLAINDTAPHTLYLTLTRTDVNTLSLKAVIDGTNIYTATQTGVTNFTFDRIIMGEGAAAVNFNMDNVLVW